MLSNTLRCSEAMQQLTFIKNRLQHLVGDAEFEEIQVEAYEVSKWQALMKEADALKAACVDTLPHLRVPYTEAELERYNSLIAESYKVIERYGSDSDNI